MIGVTLFIVAVLVIAIWSIVEVKRLKHKIFAMVLIGLILFSYISASIIFKGQDIDFKTVPGIMKAGEVYFSWLGSVAMNFKSITTNAIKMDWNGGNETSTE